MNERQGSGGIVFPVGAEIAQAEGHVAECARCQAFFASEKRFRNLLMSRLPRETAPVEFRERLAMILARERRRAVEPSKLLWLKSGRNRAIAAGALVLALALVFAVALWLNGRRPSITDRQLASTLIEDHAHTSPGQAEISSSDHKTVESWFDGKVDFSFHLPAVDDSSLKGGKLCNLQGRLAALIFYQHPESRVSLFILDGSDLDWPRERTVAVDERNYVLDSMKGYNLVMWKERGLVCSLVSDMGSADLLQMAAHF